MKHGKLIVFEGVSGTGKETQAKLLQKFLKKKGIISKIIFHPSPEVKPALRKAKSVRRQIELLARDRSDRVQHVIRPALGRGQWIISLRNYVSAYVYQGDGAAVKKVDLEPDYVFYFDLEPRISMQRILARGETLGKYETPALLHEKRKKYQDVLKNIPHMTIDASRTIALIQSDIHKYITVLTR